MDNLCLKGGITGLLHNHWFLIEEEGSSSPMEGFTKFYSNSVGEIKEFKLFGGIQQ